jgi:hypothetical protein
VVLNSKAPAIAVAPANLNYCCSGRAHNQPHAIGHHAAPALCKSLSLSDCRSAGLWRWACPVALPLLG